MARRGSEHRHVQVPPERAPRGWKASADFTVEPVWVGVAIVASILLWSAGPWIGGGLLMLAFGVWVRHRLG